MSSPAESSTAPEGLASSPPRVDDQAQLEGAAAAAAGAAAPGGALGLLKPQASWSALVLGGSGATGRVLVAKLANNPRVTKVGALVRSELPVDYFGPMLPANAAKIQQTVVDFENLDASAPAFAGYTAAFSTLGSTRSKAGSKEAFYHIDFDYITHAAQLARDAGIKHFNLMSTSGADHTSSFHYLRTKGEIEEFLKNKVKFPSLSIYRPGLLLTERQGDSRWGEWFAQKVLPVFHPILPEKHKAVFSKTVAEAMMANTEFVLAKREAAEADADAAMLHPAESNSRTFENDEIRLMKVAKL